MRNLLIITLLGLINHGSASTLPTRPVELVFTLTQKLWTAAYSPSSSGSDKTAVTYLLGKAIRETFETENKNGFVLKESSISLAENANSKVQATVSIVFEPSVADKSELMQFAYDTATNSPKFSQFKQVIGDYVITRPELPEVISACPMRSFIRQDNSIDFEPLTFTNITHQNPSGDPEGLWKLYDFDANTLYCVTFGGDGMPKVNACESEVHYSWTSEIDSDYFPTQAAPATQAAPTTPAAPAGYADVVNALAEVGVDNSDKQLSISLVWDKPCDLEIHAWQPDGAKLYYSNKGVLPSTGRLDAMDSGSLNSDGIAVENTAWVSAPAGTYRVGVENWEGCKSDIDYKLFVQIDGVTTSYERTVSGSNTLMHEVLSFSL